jgi:predicted CopG family antitoxin
MKKKLTINIESDVYDGLHRAAGKRSIGLFIEQLVRPVVAPQKLSYEELAKDKEDAQEATEWCEAHITDVGDEPW